MERRRTIAMVCVAAVALATVTAPPAPVRADGFGPPIHYADGPDHWYCFSQGTTDPTHRSYATSAMGYLDARTHLYDVYAGASCGSATDVVWVQTDLDQFGDGVFGYAPCASELSSTVCDQRWAMFDYVELFERTVACGNSGEDFVASVHKTVRHELGHSLGLRHGTLPSDHEQCDYPASDPAAGAADAMASGLGVSDLLLVSYNDHHVDVHLNPHY